MNPINIKKFGVAFGITDAMLYIGCVLVMLLLGQPNTVLFFNTWLHGFDVSSIIRTDISLAQQIIGAVKTFSLSLLIGSCIAFINNYLLNTK